MTWTVTDELRDEIECLRSKAEAVELFAERAGFRESRSLIYTARLRLSEAIQALPYSRKKSGES